MLTAGFPPTTLLCLIDSMMFKIGKAPFISDHIYYIEAPPVDVTSNALKFDLEQGT